ncbi:protein kinase C-like 3 [Ornithodoros turicata]|uniref:protein kinase C-like 3 n=1 Tax=Ornithodoros turicata TaxID=34597 RepID=UPI00313A0EAA
MSSRNAAPTQRASSHMATPVDDERIEDVEDQRPTSSKEGKKRKKKPHDEDEQRETKAQPEVELKKGIGNVETPDKKDDSFMAQTATALSRVDEAISRTALSTSSLESGVSKKVVTDVWINPKETVNWKLDSLVTLNVLGRGSFGIVYLVRHRANRQLSALKYIRKKNQSPEKERKRVEVEKSVWEAVTDHPFVVTLRAYFETAKGWCFVMEYLPEGSIRDLVRKKGPFKEEMARLLSAQMALAIHHVHEKGFLHRDISSSNVLIDGRGNAKLIDFGLSQSCYVAKRRIPKKEKNNNKQHG